MHTVIYLLGGRFVLITLYSAPGTLCANRVQTSAHRSTPSTFKFTIEEQKLLEGNWLTHNHPSGKTFGPEDILTVFANKGAGVRAVGTENTYVMKLPDKVDGVFDSQQARAVYFDEQLRGVQASMRADVNSGTLIKPSNLTQTQYETLLEQYISRFIQYHPSFESTPDNSCFYICQRCIKS